MSLEHVAPDLRKQCEGRVDRQIGSAPLFSSSIASRLVPPQDSTMEGGDKGNLCIIAPPGFTLTSARQYLTHYTTHQATFLQPDTKDLQPATSLP